MNAFPLFTHWAITIPHSFLPLLVPQNCCTYQFVTNKSITTEKHHPPPLWLFTGVPNCFYHWLPLLLPFSHFSPDRRSSERRPGVYSQLPRSQLTSYMWPFICHIWFISLNMYAMSLVCKKSGYLALPSNRTSRAINLLRRRERRVRLMLLYRFDRFAGRGCPSLSIHSSNNWGGGGH